MDSFNTVCGMASVQRIFGEGPIEGSKHIKLQTAGGPDSVFQRIILMKRVYYETSRFNFRKCDKMHLRIRYDEKVDWHKIEFASLGTTCIQCRCIQRHSDSVFMRVL